MLSKHTIELVDDQVRAIYNRLFLVKKVTGGWRPVIDLLALNQFVVLIKFRMETMVSVLTSVRKGNFMFSIDLKDTYVQIPVHSRVSHIPLFRCSLE